VQLINTALNIGSVVVVACVYSKWEIIRPFIYAEKLLTTLSLSLHGHIVWGGRDG
jgi:hypothetical protein